MSNSFIHCLRRKKWSLKPAQAGVPYPSHRQGSPLCPSFIQKVQFKPLIFLGPDFFYFASMGALNPDLLGPYLGLTVWTFAFNSLLWFWVPSFFLVYGNFSFLFSLSGDFTLHFFLSLLLFSSIQHFCVSVVGWSVPLHHLISIGGFPWLHI